MCRPPEVITLGVQHHSSAQDTVGAGQGDLTVVKVEVRYSACVEHDISQVPDVAINIVRVAVVFLELFGKVC